MGIFIGFLSGIAIGVSTFVLYIKDNIPEQKILPGKTAKTDIPILSPQKEISFIIQEPATTPSLSPSPTITPTITTTIYNTLTPTKKPTSPPTKIISFSPTNKPSATPTPTTTHSISPTLVHPTAVSMEVKTYNSEEINVLMNKFAGQYGVDVNILRHIALCESGFNTKAVNGPYAGLYQFSISSWSNYRTKIGESTSSDLRLNAEEAIKTAAYVISIGKSSIWPNCVP